MKRTLTLILTFVLAVSFTISLSASTGMSYAAFNTLLREVKSSKNIQLIQDAAQNNKFTVQQLIELITVFSDRETDERLEVLRLVCPTVSDKDQLYKVYDFFKFRSDRDKAKKIIVSCE